MRFRKDTFAPFFRESPVPYEFVCRLAVSGRCPGRQPRVRGTWPDFFSARKRKSPGAWGTTGSSPWLNRRRSFRLSFHPFPRRADSSKRSRPVRAGANSWRALHFELRHFLPALPKVLDNRFLSSVRTSTRSRRLPKRSSGRRSGT